MTDKAKLRNIITSSIYGGDWKETDVADAYKPDVEVIMDAVVVYAEKLVAETKKDFTDKMITLFSNGKMSGDTANYQAGWNNALLVLNEQLNRPSDTNDS